MFLNIKLLHFIKLNCSLIFFNAFLPYTFQHHIFRYCLDGPVVFTDDVIWFCEDCEQEVVDAEYPDEDTTDSEKGEVNYIEHCVNVVDLQPIADPIWK
jgi:hypothetical protein